jgi:hypothetical protein
MTRQKSGQVDRPSNSYGTSRAPLNVRATQQQVTVLVDPMWHNPNRSQCSGPIVTLPAVRRRAT